MDSCQPLIHMRDVVKVYPTAAGDFTALKTINLQVGAGEFLGIVGKSGAGKSTLMKILGGAVAMDAGTIEISGKGVAVPSPAVAQRLGIGVIYQGECLGRIRPADISPRSSAGGE